ncbi:hypothetical protein LCGC14_2706030 [marine sediment metagenome]|uniref:Uncharacterized protein n=1 Tax=marine sediment metagenome TaxID=412755 RepID=A0A0F9BNE7_9ZZZZ
MTPQVAQVVAQTIAAPGSLTLIVVILGALFALIGGSYGFTWLVFDRLSKSISRLRTNELKHMEDRIKELEER